MKNNIKKIKKINIGLDIGITSVGWSILDENHNIIDMGVRLFDDVANPKDGKLKNESRREHRSMRRMINRKRLRKMTFIKYLIDNSWINNNEEQIYNLLSIDITKFNVDNPIELRVKSLRERLGNAELIFLLFNYLNHRGYFYDDEEEENNKDKKDSKKDKEDKINFKPDKSLTPSENILKFYEQYGYYKGSQTTKYYSNEAYCNEIRKILEAQQSFGNNKITDQFIEDYLNIFSRVRKYTEGPGIDWYNNTNYSRLKLEEKDPKDKPFLYDKSGNLIYDKSGNLIKDISKYNLYDNIWQKVIGKCTYYPDEYRGSKKAPITLVYNFLNDLNNFKIDENHLDEKQKELIIDNLNNITLELIKKDEIKEIKNKDFEFKKIFIEPLNQNLNKDDKYNTKIDYYRFSGIKKEESKKTVSFIIENLSKYIEFIWFYSKYKLININNNIDIFDSNNNSLLNELNVEFNELRLKANKRERVEYLKNKINVNNQDNKLDDNITELLKDCKFNETCSLSYKAMNEYINYVLNHKCESINQMQFFMIKIKILIMIKVLIKKNIFLQGCMKKLFYHQQLEDRLTKQLMF